jgi:Short C-terminal domain
VPIMRRRPMLRAVAVGGTAYMVGKNSARKQADQQSQDAAQDQHTSDLEQQQAAVPAPRAAGPSMTDQLNQLSGLRNQGVLSDDEFAAAKAKLLGS